MLIVTIWIKAGITGAVEISAERVQLLEQQVNDLTRRLQLLETKWYAIVKDKNGRNNIKAPAS